MRIPRDMWSAPYFTNTSPGINNIEQYPIWAKKSVGRIFQKVQFSFKKSETNVILKVSAGDRDSFAASPPFPHLHPVLWLRCPCAVPQLPPAPQPAAAHSASACFTLGSAGWRSKEQNVGLIRIFRDSVCTPGNYRNTHSSDKVTLPDRECLQPHLDKVLRLRDFTYTSGVTQYKEHNMQQLFAHSCTSH